MKTASEIRALLLAVLVSMISLGGAFTLATAFGPAPAEAGLLTDRSPAQSASAGRAMFVQSCTHCHGDDATGSGEDGDGPDLRRLRISNARIATVIRQGIRGEMPSFAKKHSASDIAALTIYLRSLR